MAGHPLGPDASYVSINAFILIFDTPLGGGYRRLHLTEEESEAEEDYGQSQNPQPISPAAWTRQGCIRKAHRFSPVHTFDLTSRSPGDTPSYQSLSGIEKKSHLKLFEHLIQFKSKL